MGVEIKTADTWETYAPLGFGSARDYTEAKSVFEAQKCPMCLSALTVEQDTHCKCPTCHTQLWPHESWAVSFENRHYFLFGVLAGVRGSGHYQISPPRGFPDDMDDRTKHFADGEHSPSWLAIDEILNFDWEVLDLEPESIEFAEYDAWPDAKKPPGDRTTSPKISPECSIKEITEEDYCIHRNALQKRHPQADAEALRVMQRIYLDCGHVTAEVPTPYSSLCSAFLADVRRLMKSLPGLSPDRVRLVFNFDN